METIPKLRRVEQTDVTSISEIALTTLREKFTTAISHETAKERIDALEYLIVQCSAPLQALEAGAELSLEYELFLTALTRMHMLEKARARFDEVLSLKF